MFALQNQNQYIQQLSQITSFVSMRKICNSYRKYHKKSKKNENVTYSKLCDDNNKTWPKTCELDRVHLKSITDSIEPLIFNRVNTCGFSNAFANILFGSSTKTVPLPVSSTFVWNQKRFFKTARTLTAETKRNPSLVKRLQEFLAGAETGKLPNDWLNNEQLKKLLLTEGETLSEALKTKIKVAFAEGYLIANSLGVEKNRKTFPYLRILQYVFSFLIFVLLVANLFSSSPTGIFRFSLSNQTEVDPEEINVKFKDVRGVDEAKQELTDVVEYLKNPDKFTTLGGKLPKGVLLVGPPGTGKTLLARAVAGEAGVPFFHASGSEFEELLVGQGAKRVRELFKTAKEKTPCVIFIDEIDSVGSKRTNSVLHPYANQTINQLLSEMDGFHQNEGIIVLGATNRRDDLDQALLRPGRFDLEVIVPRPDYTGRKEILDYYLHKVISKDINLDQLARSTTGFTGADIENMVNQAALKAALDEAKHVSMKYLESARDKIIMGPEKKGRIPDEGANLITAYHEGGHATVAFFTKDSHPIHKVTIIPRGSSLGHTAYIPEKEQYHITKSQMLASLDTMMGGRAAEELVFGPDRITSGASSDLKQATSLALNMVREWGMSEKVGLRTIQPDTNRMFTQPEQLGPSTSEQIDSEIKQLLNESYERAKQILKTYSKQHKALAEALLKYETLDADDVKAILTDQKPKIEM